MRERKDKYPERRCSICKSTRGFIRSYGLKLCRRCFKDNALKLGFRKYN